MALRMNSWWLVRGRSRRMAARLSNEAEAAAVGGFEKASEAVAKLRVQTDEAADSSENGTDAVDALNDALGGLDKSGKKAGKGLEKALSETEAFDKAMKEAALSAEDLGRNKANILISGVDSLSDAFGDFTARGFRDFKGFTDSIVDSFQSALAQMISMAARNQIMIGLGFGGQAGGIGGLIPGGAAQVGGVAQSGLGLLQGAGSLANLLGGGGALAGVASSGSVGVLSGGGLVSSFANALADCCNWFGWWSFRSVGAALPGCGGVAAAISFFSSKTKLLDSGVRITVEQCRHAGRELPQHLEKSPFLGAEQKAPRDLLLRLMKSQSRLSAPSSSIWDGDLVRRLQVLGVAASEAWDDFSLPNPSIHQGPQRGRGRRG